MVPTQETISLEDVIILEPQALALIEISRMSKDLQSKIFRTYPTQELHLNRTRGRL